jgi:hypothetical protein
MVNMKIKPYVEQQQCTVSEIYNHTSSDRLQLINFYDSEFILGEVC